MAQKSKKVTARQPKFESEAGYKLREKLIRDINTKVNETYGLMGLLYDMEWDYRKSAQIITSIDLCNSVDTEIGNFEVRLLTAKTHRATRRHYGGAAFKFYIHYRGNGEQETRIETVVVSEMSTSGILYSFAQRAKDTVQEWYEDIYYDKYGSDTEAAAI